MILNQKLFNPEEIDRLSASSHGYQQYAESLASSPGGHLIIDELGEVDERRGEEEEEEDRRIANEFETSSLDDDHMNVGFGSAFATLFTAN